MIFESGILGGAHHFWGDPYLNNTTTLFDIAETKHKNQ